VSLCVGFDGAMLRTPHTGSGQYSAALIGALRALPEIAIVLLSSVPLPNEPGAIVVPPPRFLKSERGRKVWWEQIGIGRAARQAGVGVVHIPYFAAPLRQAVQHVVTVHDVIPLLMPAYAGGRAMRAYLRLVSAGTRRAAQVIADSACSRRDAIRVLKLSGERVTTIPLAVSADFGAVRDEALIARLRDQYGLHGKRVMFNVAGLDVRKNVATLLRAFARISADMDDDDRLRAKFHAIEDLRLARQVPNALLHDRALRITHLEEDDAVHPHRDVVAGDDLLMRDVHRQESGVHEPHRVHHREDQDDTRSLQPVKLAEAQDDAPLPLRRHANDVAQVQRHEEGGDRAQGQRDARARKARRSEAQDQRDGGAECPEDEKEDEAQAPRPPYRHH